MKRCPTCGGTVEERRMVVVPPVHSPVPRSNRARCTDPFHDRKPADSPTEERWDHNTGVDATWGELWNLADAKISALQAEVERLREALREAASYFAVIESGPRKITTDQALATEAKELCRAALAQAEDPR